MKRATTIIRGERSTTLMYRSDNRLRLRRIV